jgi:hypothetical protein
LPTGAWIKSFLASMITWFKSTGFLLVGVI